VNVLVTGGAGYIGSHMVKLLGERGHRAVVLDDLSTGHRDAVGDARLVEGDVGDEARVRALLEAEKIGAVVHFAAFSLVAESVAEPEKYRRNNVVKAEALLRAMRSAKVERLVHSSSAAVYGEPQSVPVDEAHPLRPINPYGASKLSVERLLEAAHAGAGLRSISLRYFNAAGADPSGRLGERHEPETHLIPLVLQAAAGRRKAVEVYGSDFPTRDGTCVRDYVHVSDLCEAHLRALEWLEGGGGREAVNLGSERGASVLEVIEAARLETGAPIPAVSAPRRAGDPAALVASTVRAARVLGWRARADLREIVRDAWRWEQRRSGGR
jgi:UDP-glucose 4-epimerase